MLLIINNAYINSVLGCKNSGESNAVSIKERKIIMVHLVPLGLALIVALVTLLVVFFLSEDNEQSKCKVMFLIYLFAIYEIFFS